MKPLTILSLAIAAAIAALLAATHRLFPSLVVATGGAGGRRPVPGRCHWLAPLLLLCCMANPLWAAQFGDFTYTDNGTSITITDYPSTAVGVVDIPASIVGKPVTQIGDFAFQDCGSLTGVTIPAGVTHIGSFAFQNNSSLTGLTLPASLTHIGDFAFHGCGNLTGITLPAGVVSIGNYAFYRCGNLTSASFAGNAPTLGTKVFQSAAVGFTVHYFIGATGFTSPTWLGYPAVGVPPSLPVFTIQPLASQTIPSGTTTTLTVEAVGSPAPTLQWYQGLRGDISLPLAGAIGNTFTTPALTSSTSYWVRATNTQGTADSDAAVVSISFSNNNLSNLVLSAGTLSPVFDAAAASYSAKVASTVAGLTVTPTVAAAGATVKVNNTTVASGTASGFIGLSEGSNVITTVVTAADGVTSKTYTVTVTRAAPVLVVTELPEVLDSATVVLKGTVNPHGVATVFFEYGTTTAYGNTTPGEELSGELATDFQVNLGGLTGSATYHYRAVAVSAAGTVHGGDVPFATLPDAPLAATGDPTAVSASGATLVGAVDPKGLATDVYFEYGLTSLYGKTTPVQRVPAGAGIVDVQAPKGALMAAATYHYRIVASSAAGSAVGEDVEFVVMVGGGVPSAVPIAKPIVHTEGVAGVGSEGATLLGSVNPNEGTTIVHFEYGPTSSYGRTSAMQGVGNGNTLAAVSLPATGLPYGTPCHYRLVASNSLGTTLGTDALFTTTFPPPAASTGDALVLTTTSTQVGGAVRAHNSVANVTFEYGTDGITFPNSVTATPASVAGDASTPVSADLTHLAQGVTYFYRVRATGAGGTGLGDTKFFKVAMLSGLIQQFPVGVAPAERQGAVNVTLTPGGIGGWRLAGEQAWRQSGVPATGLSSGERVLEYRPVTGYLQPVSETVAVVSGAAMVPLERAYQLSAWTGSGGLLVTLKPEDLALGSVATARRAQWRLAGEGDTEWKDSGTTVSGLVPGNHLIECKDVPGR
ncbi:MAG: leucine-rich repeat protein, partial [Verrucomicrobia bacterium]|nr:leucine-rich repeat protein [Verrucomicrobiota bacterium]